MLTIRYADSEGMQVYIGKLLDPVTYIIQFECLFCYLIKLSDVCWVRSAVIVCSVYMCVCVGKWVISLACVHAHEWAHVALVVIIGK